MPFKLWKIILLDCVEFASIDDYFYVKKGDYPFTLESSYNNELIHLNNNIFDYLCHYIS
jgi:hypothetical protein